MAKEYFFKPLVRVLGWTSTTGHVKPGETIATKWPGLTFHSVVRWLQCHRMPQSHECVVRFRFWRLIRSLFLINMASSVDQPLMLLHPVATSFTHNKRERQSVMQTYSEEALSRRTTYYVRNRARLMHFDVDSNMEQRHNVVHTCSQMFIERSDPN